MFTRFIAAGAALALATSAFAALDGINVQADAAAAALDLLAVQDSPTQFGNSTAGTQASPGGSELDLLYGGIEAGFLKLSITGNLESNYNKMWIFIDALSDAGENPLQPGNVDGGFNEIQNFTGMTFDDGFVPDHGLRLEVGDGFGGVRFFNLVDNTAGDVDTFGGFGSLPRGPIAGGFGVSYGWDNSNNLGVNGTGDPAGDPMTADKGWEFVIDMSAAFGRVDPSNVKVLAFVTSGDGTFLSNQFLPGINNPNNLGGNPGGIDFNNILGLQCATVPYVPEPASLLLLGLGALLRRR